MTTLKQDTPDAWRQSWYNWVRMAEKTLVGAARMAWHSEDERTLDISLFGKVTGLPPMTVATWKDSVTWTATVLLGLSIEQCLKALIIRASSDGEYPHHHNLLRLWDELGDCDRQGIADEIVALARRTAGTRFDAFPTPATLTEVRAIIRHYQDVFEKARYHLESLHEDKPRNVMQQITTLARNGELWKLALAAYGYAKRLAPSPSHLIEKAGV